MLYFLNMNLRQPPSPETIKGGSDLPPAVSVLLNELSPFGVFLSQFVYMAGWLFPDNHLPESLASLADRMEFPETSEAEIVRPDVHD
jgi:hypothetical protein